jgi:hypothetical protein
MGKIANLHIGPAQPIVSTDITGKALYQTLINGSRLPPATLHRQLNSLPTTTLP